MNKSASLILVAMLSALASTASADPWKDESGHGKARGHQYKEEYWEGDCKVKRKVGKHGDVKEERKCKAPRRPERHEVRETIVEERVYYPVQEAPPPREPGVSINVHIGR